jgi:hypothetical protein
MPSFSIPEWDPSDPQVQSDQVKAFDQLRQQCPVAHSARLHWTILQHADVVRILEDHESFSNAVSSHRSVPNGMDPPEHTAYRALVERYFTPQVLARFEPTLQALCTDLLSNVNGDVDIIRSIAQPFSVRAQCAFMGWPDTLHTPLLDWMAANHAATLSGDIARQSEVARQFDLQIRNQLNLRRQLPTSSVTDITSQLMQETINGQPVDDESLVSLIRNWTAGELGTITASVSILCYFLARRPDIQSLVRAEPTLRTRAIDEILRIEAPLIANRRITTKPVEISGRQLQAGERLTLLWASANRDERVFGPEPDRFDLNRNPDDNLLYGRGLHVCPGAPLARLELRTVLDALLRHTRNITTIAGHVPVKAIYPAGGYGRLALRLEGA